MAHTLLREATAQDTSVSGPETIDQSDQPAGSDASRSRRFLRELTTWRLDLARYAVRAPEAKGIDDAVLSLSVEWLLIRSVMAAILTQRRYAGEDWLSLLQGAVSTHSRQGAVAPDALEPLFSRLDGLFGAPVFSPQPTLARLALDSVQFSAFVDTLREQPSLRPTRAGVAALGHAYEHFRTRTLRCNGQQVTDAPARARRKSMSTFFTPAHVVTAIVDQTLGALLRTRNGGGIGADPRVVDPACGCGVFLLAAYERLAGWPGHDASRRQHAWRPPVALRILADSIFGLDVDPEAVAITRFSLLCSAWDTMGWPVTLDSAAQCSQVVGPHLSRNVRCGNAVVGTDVLNDVSFEARDERLKLRPVDWDEAFSVPMQAGGFDAVIGNPPYQSAYSRESTRLPAWQKAYFASRYGTVSGRINTFVLFIEKGLGVLRHGGRLGFVLPESFLMVTAYRTSREFVLKHGLRRVTLCGASVFPGATVPACIVSAANDKPERPYDVVIYRADEARGTQRPFQRLSTDEIWQDPEHRVHAAVPADVRAVLERIREAGVPLMEVAKVEDGINPGPFREQFVSTQRDDPRQMRLVEGRDIARYGTLPWRHLYFLWDERLAYRLRRRQPGSLAVLGRRERFLVGEKILTRQTARGITATLDREGFCCTNSVHTTRLLEPEGRLRGAFLLAVLNSKLASFYYRHFYGENSGAFPQVKVRKLRQLPMPRLALSRPDDRERHDRIAALAEELIELHRLLRQTAPGSGLERLRARIAAAERSVDESVFSLYGLSGQDVTTICAQST